MIQLNPDITELDPVEKILTEPVSASRINLFHSCRLKFYFRYVLKLTKPTSPALYVGKTVHAMLQEWSKRRWMGKPATSLDLRPHFETHWCKRRSKSAAGAGRKVRHQRWKIMRLLPQVKSGFTEISLWNIRSGAQDVPQGRRQGGGYLAPARFFAFRRR